MIKNSTLVTAPAQDPISLASLKTFLRIDGSDEDALLGSILKAATKRLETYCNQKFVDQTWDMFFDCFPYAEKDQWWDGVKQAHINTLINNNGGVINLPFGPLKSVTGFYTYDEDNTEYTYAASNYYADVNGPFGRIALKDSATWPTTILRPLNGIKIRGVFGMGTGYIADPEAASEIPEEIQEAIKQFAAVMYEHRGDEQPKIPQHALMLIAPYVHYKVGR